MLSFCGCLSSFRYRFFAKICRLLRKFAFSLRKYADFCENVQIFAEIRKFCENVSIFFCENLQIFFCENVAIVAKISSLFFFAKICRFFRKFADFCENLQIYAKMRRFSKIRKLARMLDRYIFGFLDFCENAETSLFGFLNFCENPQNGTQILRASFS